MSDLIKLISSQLAPERVRLQLSSELKLSSSFKAERDRGRPLLFGVRFNPLTLVTGLTSVMTLAMTLISAVTLISVMTLASVIAPPAIIGGVTLGYGQVAPHTKTPAFTRKKSAKADAADDAIFEVEALPSPPSSAQDPSSRQGQKTGAKSSAPTQADAKRERRLKRKKRQPKQSQRALQRRAREKRRKAQAKRARGELNPKKRGAQPPTVIEGELVRVGQIGLLPWENRFGIQIGIERLGEVYYSALNIGINHTFSARGEPLKLTLGVPLRFELLDARPNQRFENVGRFRAQDWDEASDYAKVLQRLSVGSKEGRFYLDINRFSARTLGHGLIMKRYDSNLNFNTSRVGVQLDAFSDYVGFESTVNDIVNPNIIGGLVFVKPLSLINRSNYLTRSLSFGFSGVTDVRAPIRNTLDTEDVDNDGRRDSELQLDQQTFRPESLFGRVNAYGVDAEIKLVDRRAFDLKTYLDYSILDASLPVGNPTSIDPKVVGLQRVRSSGFAWGHLIRSNLGLDPIHALRFRLEYRNYEPNYIPSYFDSLYEIQSIQYLPSGASMGDLANATKLQRVFSRDYEAERIHGGYFEANWRIGDVFALAFGLEINSQTPDNHAFFHFELPRAGNWQVSSTYHRRNVTGGELFALDFKSNDIWMFQTRHRTLSWLNTNLSVMTPFGFGPSSVFQNAIQVNLSLEFGFSYGDKKKPKGKKKPKPVKGTPKSTETKQQEKTSSVNTQASPTAPKPVRGAQP